MLLPFSLSVFLPLLLWRAYRLGRGCISPPFLLLSYLVLAYVGSLGTFFEYEHYTFLFLFAGALAAWLGTECASVDRRTRRGRLRILAPRGIATMMFSLDVAAFLLIGLAAHHIALHGVQLFTQDWYLVTPGEYSAGLADRLSYTIGGTGLGALAVASYALYKSVPSRSTEVNFFLLAAAYLAINVLNGAKSAAIMPLILLGLAVFHANRKLPRGALLAGVCAAALLAAGIGSVWIESGLGSSVWSLYSERLTRNASETFDFELYGPGFGEIFSPFVELEAEAKRVSDQITGAPRSPLFNEFVGNVLEGRPFFSVNGVSPELTILGAGFANFGVGAGLAYAFLAAFLAQRLNLWLLSTESIGIFWFAALVGLEFLFLGFMRSGAAILETEAFFTEIIFPLFLALVGYRLVRALSRRRFPDEAFHPSARGFGGTPLA